MAIKLINFIALNLFLCFENHLVEADSRTRTNNLLLTRQSHYHCAISANFLSYYKGYRSNLLRYISFFLTSIYVQKNRKILYFLRYFLKSFYCSGNISFYLCRFQRVSLIVILFSFTDTNQYFTSSGIFCKIYLQRD